MVESALAWPGVGTADRVLDAATESFGTRGYDSTSLDALAAELGIRKQTILYWFPSKEALLEAVIDRSAAELSVYLYAVPVFSGALAWGLLGEPISPGMVAGGAGVVAGIALVNARPAPRRAAAPGT